MEKLTDVQKKIYQYIVQCVSARKYPPSVREICAAVGLRSPSTVQLHLNTLDRLGYISRDPGRMRSIALLDPPEHRGIPVVGRVAAGRPILAEEDIVGTLPYDPGEDGEYFALRICGDSMVGAGILDGDMVVVRKQQTAENGEIVIALLEDEATCKRLKRSDGKVWLLPENEAYSPISGEGALILGRVFAVIRTY